MKTLRNTVRFGWGMLLAAAVLGVSVSAASEPAAAPASETVCVPDLTGEWSGYWESDVNGHTGPIRARVERLDACHYRVVFCGRFWRVCPFRYTTTLRITGYGPGYVCLGGSHRLGPVFGTFSYNARATQTHFVSRYCAEDDHGTFVMTRCCR
jgi:hypothetical protein